MSSRNLGGTLVLSLYVQAGVNILQLVAVTQKELKPGMSGRSCRACSEYKTVGSQLHLAGCAHENGESGIPEPPGGTA